MSDPVLLFLAAWVAYKAWEVFGPDRRKTKGRISSSWTLVAVVLSGAAAYGLAIAEHILAPRSFGGVAVGAGVALLVGRTFLKHAAMRALGRHWSIQVELRDDQKVCHTGPYRFVRHPGYLSMLLEFPGLALVAGTPLVLLYGWTVHALVLAARIRVEERELRARFPEAYPAYAASVRPLFPRWGSR